MGWEDWDGVDEDGFGYRGRGKYSGRRKPDNGHSIPNIRAIKQTAAALLVTGEGLSTDPFGTVDAKQEEWIPLSQLHTSSEVREEGDEGTLVISTWLAEKKGLV